MSNIEITKVTTNYDFEIPEGLEDQEAYDWVLPEIEKSWNKAKDSIFETGKWLVSAKERTVHGDWKDFVKTRPFKKSTEEKLRNIAECETFSRPEVYEALPNSWATLDQLRMRAEDKEDEFLEQVKEERVFSDMTRENAKYLYGKTESNDGGVYLKAMSDDKMEELFKANRLFDYRTQLVDELKRVEDKLASEVEEAA